MWDRRAVVARIRSAELHAAWAPHHRLSIAEASASWWHDTQFVASCFQFVARLLWQQRFDLHVAAGERSLRKPAGLERFLDVHAEVGDVAHELRVRLALVPTAHDPEADLDLALLHECGNDRVQRTLVRLERVRTIFVEREQAAAVLQHEAR